MNVFNELKERGLIAQMTHEEKIIEILDKEKVSFYIGFDPTADSLHVGHFLQLVVMKHLQMAGHRPIAILGAGTAMVGDPTGRTDMRQMMTPETIKHNADCFRHQMSRFVDFSEGKALMLDNSDWLLKLNYVDFLRDIGVHFSVNKMLSAECYKSRLQVGLSFIEFNYMLMQSYDFLKLYKDYDCKMQLGGDDQWANILGGIELIRRAEGKEAYGMTFTLLTTSEGNKMGKTQNGAVWLDREKTTPYEFFQYWRNIDDPDVFRVMRLLTFIPVSEIKKMEKECTNINEAKEKLAYELTKMVHGEEDAQRSLTAAKALFGGEGDLSNIPEAEISENDLNNGEIGVLELLVITKICPSKGEARRLIDQKGLQINSVLVSSFSETVSVSALKDGIIVKKGKKSYTRVVLR